MAVSDEITAIRAGKGNDAEKSRAIASLKAQRLHERIPSMSRPFQRNGVRWTIREFGTEDRNGVTMLRIVAKAQIPGGPVLIDYDHPLNPFYFVNPPVMVPDGEEPDPENPGQMRALYREDPAEAVRLMLASKISG